MRRVFYYLFIVIFYSILRVLKRFLVKNFKVDENTVTAGEQPDDLSGSAVQTPVRRRRQDEEEQPLSAFEAQCAPDKYTRPTPDQIRDNYPDGYEPKHLAMKPCLMNQEMEDVGEIPPQKEQISEKKSIL